MRPSPPPVDARTRDEPKATPRRPTRILLTGGAGFIGSHVVEALLQHGVGVTVLDDFSTGREENLPNDARVRVVRGDAAARAALLEAIEGCQRVGHLAAIASVPRSLEDPVGTHRTNAVATMQVLEAARHVGIDRVVYASSAAVYGNAQAPPVVERGPLRPRTPYAIDKLMGELYLETYAGAHGMTNISLRFFNVYGPRQRPDSPYSGVISLFAARARAGEPIDVVGDGAQTRDFIHVSDVANVFVQALLRPDPLRFAVLNVGTGRPTSVLELIAAIEHLVGKRLARQHVSPRPGEVRYSHAGVTRLDQAFGNQPRRRLEIGLAELLSPARVREA